MLRGGWGIISPPPSHFQGCRCAELVEDHVLYRAIVERALLESLSICGPGMAIQKDIRRQMFLPRAE